MSEHASLFSLQIDPIAVIESIRQTSIPFEVLGPEEDWRKIIITPDPQASSQQLTLSLKQRSIDQVFFRKKIPDLMSTVQRITAFDPRRQESLLRLIPNWNVCIELTAEPTFYQHPDFLRVMTLVARLVEGVFVIPTGFLDSESREILMNNGTSNPQAVLPVGLPFPAPTDTPLTQSAPSALPRIETPTGAHDFLIPDARRVAERMYVMLAVAYRGVLDINPDRPNRDAYLARLADWFWSMNIGHELEEHERYVLDQPLGELGLQRAQELVQSFEAVSILAWALELVELTAHDQFVQPKRLVETLGLFREDARFVIDSAQLRCEAEIRTVADRILAVHWRLRELEIHPRPVDFLSMCRDGWFGAFDTESLTMIENDLSVSQQPITRIDPTMRQRLHQSIRQRHQALNWLCGHHPVFSHVKIST
ncbi:MAG: hypothetical protein KatS3mg104_0285 [Phycisphaerae bacterium]|nr:MAG: hypothetical protein KatS3mg104_0285 [Phycisphaerae bacterium]